MQCGPVRRGRAARAASREAPARGRPAEQGRPATSRQHGTGRTRPSRVYGGRSRSTPTSSHTPITRAIKEAFIARGGAGWRQPFLSYREQPGSEM